MSECCKDSRKYGRKAIILTERQIDPLLFEQHEDDPGYYNRRKY